MKQRKESINQSRIFFFCVQMCPWPWLVSLICHPDIWDGTLSRMTTTTTTTIRRQRSQKLVHVRVWTCEAWQRLSSHSISKISLKRRPSKRQQYVCVSAAKVSSTTVRFVKVRPTRRKKTALKFLPIRPLDPTDRPALPHCITETCMICHAS